MTNEPLYPPEPEGDSFASEALEDWELEELAAAHRAMPLRTVIALATKRTVVLSCGHIGTASVRLAPGEVVRCRKCYEQGMEAARAMVEGMGR